MKRQIDARSDETMRFFTPELYLRFNSANDEVADRADQQWEAAVRAYQEHLKNAGDQMPRDVRALADLCLHDCELLGWDEEIEPHPRLSAGPLPVWSAFSVLSLRRNGEVVTLNYVLWDKVRRSPAPKDWVSSGASPSWLYDEVDVAQAEHGKFLHRILFSDGTTAEVPFSIVLVHTVAWDRTPLYNRLPRSA